MPRQRLPLSTLDARSSTPSDLLPSFVIRISSFGFWISSFVISHSSFCAALGAVSILDTGAIPDATTVNTPAIQSAIDRLASSGGGTVVIPPGIFVSGALDLRPGIHLHLEKGAVLRAVSSDVATHFPARPTRIEGQRLDFTPALINADSCDGLRITGEGTLDGDGRPVWDEFWRLRRAAPDPKNFPNLSVPRARLALISRSRDVLIEGVAFQNSQFWNLHLYLCREVTVRGARFLVPDDYKQAPSTDGIDIDSSQDVLIEGCTFSVTDDAIALKGTKGPRALEDTASPPVERVRIRDCRFRRAHGVLTCGSEATIVRDVVLENSRVTGPMTVLTLKLRSDTPQTYENIHLRDLTLEADGGALLAVRPWTQFIDLKGLPPPASIVRDITLQNITGRFGSFGTIAGNRDQTTFGDITLENITATFTTPQLKAPALPTLHILNVPALSAP